MTKSLIKAVRAGDDVIALRDHLLGHGFTVWRAMSAESPYKPGRHRAVKSHGRWTVEALSDFALAVEKNLDGLTAISTGTCPGCWECANAHGFDPESAESMAEFRAEWEAGGTDAYDELYFSWSACDVCGSRLGGDRSVWHAIRAGDESREILHSTCCVDCAMFLANGEEPEDWQG